VRVTRVVAEQLATSEDVVILRGELDRESLCLAVVELTRPEERLAWLADHLGELDGSGIVYTLTVAGSQEIAGFLRERGHDVAAYSGQTDPTERLALEQDLLAGRLKALVATSALGMGFDAALGFVVNVGAPASPVAYYQQVGRAGRGLEGKAQAPVILLPAHEDRDIWRYFASLAFPAEQHVRVALKALSESDRPMSTATLETYVDLSRGRLEMMLKVLDVDGAVRRVQGGWTATGQDWVYEQDRYDRVAAARRDEQAAMLEYIATDGCRMRFLREALDDPGAADCGRCDNCGGVTIPTSVSEAAVANAGDRLSRPGVALQPRKLWPTALANLGVDLGGRIAGAEEGRVVARLTDLGLGQALRDIFRPGEPDQEVPVALVQGVVATLADWGPRPDGIVGFESRSHPLLVESLVDGLSRHLGVPMLGRVTIRDDSIGPGQGATNSAQRVAAVSRRSELRAEDVGGKRVLLVDDLVASGWSMTLAAHWLRTDGAAAVLPLALGSET
jgi:ATP-dependent DNA helicase RecQ